MAVGAFALLWVVLGSVDGGMAFTRRFEIVPMFGFRAGGTFEDSTTGDSLRIDESIAYGLALNMDYDSQSQLQLIWSRQPTEIKTPSASEPSLDLIIDYYHFSSTYSWSKEAAYRPYVLLSIGATYMQPDRSGLDDELFFSMGAALGLKYYFTDHIGLMIEGRGFGTYLGGSSSIFCSSGSDGGRCGVRVDGDALFQFNGFGGLVFRF